jgi:ubiquinone biosynthesis protein UbiJ
MVSMLNQAALASLEQALNAALALDPHTVNRLRRMDDKVIALALEGLGFTLYVQSLDGHLRLMAAWDGPVDTTLRGAPFSLLRMGSGRTGEGLFRGGVEIDGDVELGQQFQRVFEKMDIDWEEHLSRLCGDVIAHQLGNVARDLRHWAERSLDHLQKDAADYLQEEREALPLEWEVEEFYQQVDTLRSDVDRMEARLKRLEKKVLPRAE